MAAGYMVCGVLRGVRHDEGIRPADRGRLSRPGTTVDEPSGVRHNGRIRRADRGRPSRPVTTAGEPSAVARTGGYNDAGLPRYMPEARAHRGSEVSSPWSVFPPALHEEEDKSFLSAQA